MYIVRAQDGRLHDKPKKFQREFEVLIPLKAANDDNRLP